MERIVETPHADLRETKAVSSAVPLKLAQAQVETLVNCRRNRTTFSKGC